MYISKRKDVQMGTNLEKRGQELRDAIMRADNTLIRFLDTINSVEELEQLAPILKEKKRGGWFDFYRQNLTRWENPQLSNGFKSICPRLAARLDTPQKVRILFRGADPYRVSPLLMGKVLEDIISRHEVEKCQVVTYHPRPGSRWYDALKIVCDDRLQAWTLTDLALPGEKRTSINSQGIFIDWRTEKEQKTTGNTR